MIRVCIGAFALLLLSACALTPAKTEQISEPVKQTDLSADLRLLEAQQQARPDDIKIQEQLQALKHQIQLLEDDHLQQAQNLWDKKQWGAALNQLDAGLLSIPESTRLQRRRTYFKEILDRRLSLPREELILLRGRYVADVLRVHKQAASVAPNFLATEIELKALEDERVKLGQEIADIGFRALQRKHNGFARWAFNVAADLANANGKRGLQELARVENVKSKTKPVIATEPELTEQQVLEERRQTLKAEAQSALDKPDLFTAKRSLQQARALFPNDAEFDAITKKLTPLIELEVQRLQKDGTARYQQGHIDEAIKQWRKALQLDPKHKELPSLIERAQRVQSNLDSLKK